MKIPRITALMTFALAAIIFTSCNQSIVTNRQAETAETGIHVYEAAEDVYESLEEMDYFYKQKGKYLKVLAGDSLRNRIPELGFNTDGINAVTELNFYTEKVYRSYEMLSDIGVNLERSAIRPNFELLAAQLDSFELDKSRKSMLDELKLAAKAHKFERKEIMFDISALYLYILEKDISKRKEQLDISLSKYNKALQELPEKIFDIEKLKQLVDAPVKNADAIVGLYKLKLRDEAYQKQKELTTQMDILLQAVRTLNRVHAEFIKQNTSGNDIDKYIAEIRELLELEDKKSKTLFRK